MKNENSDIYSKWLENKLSPEELLSLQNSGEIDVLSKIINEVDTWQTPEIQLDYTVLKNTIATKTKRAKIVSLYKRVSLAASVLIIIGVGIGVFFSTSETTYTSSFGEIKNITFPDGTTAILNSNSTISFVEDNWENNRIVQLTGQAFFNINIKGEFAVKINGGSVNVLGTKFDVLSAKKYNIIKCFEGSVHVQTEKIKQTLIAGTGIDSENKLFKITELEPNWNQNYSKFNGAKLIEVINALCLKFEITIDTSKVDINKKMFTGQFSNKDKNLALKMVFKPLGISYKIENKVVILK